MPDTVIYAIGLLGLLVGLTGLARFAVARLRSDEPPVESFKPISEWRPTGHIDFANLKDEIDISQTRARKEGSFVLRVEDYRIIESMNIGGAKRLEYRWRRATLREAKIVASMHNRSIASADESVALAIRSPGLVPAGPQRAAASGNGQIVSPRDQSEAASPITAH